MKTFIQRIVLLALLFASASLFANPITELQSVKLKQLNLQETAIILHFTHNVPAKPKSFWLENPERLIIDLPNTDNKVKNNQITHSNLVSHVDIVSADHRTRLVVSLTQETKHQLQVKGKTVTLLLTPKSAAATKNLINTLNFKKGELAGSGKLVIDLKHASIQSQLNRQADQLDILLKNTKINPDLARQFDVSDFNTPAKFIRLVQQKSDTLLHITTTGKYEEAAFQLDHQFIVELVPADTVAASQDQKYHGERVSLNFQSVPVRQVLKVLAEFNDSNVIISDKITGNISLNLTKVPWDQALNLILKSHNLAEKQMGNVTLIAPANDIIAMTKQQLQNQQDLKDLGALDTETFHIKYGKAQTYYTTLKESLLSSRGKIIMNERTNMLFIRDTAEQLKAIRHYIDTTDIPVKQVEIEARIVTVDKGFERELGIRWNVNQSSIPNPDTEGDPGKRGFNLDLGSGQIGGTNPASLALATLSGDMLIGMELSALEAEGGGEILSSPRLLTADQQEAVIEQGTEIPYNESTSSGAAALAFKSAVLRLKVTPQITPDNKIMLRLQVNQDAKSKETAGKDAVPIIDTRHITTNVLVNNGETVVLGGIYERSKSNSTTRVPFLSAIPLLGELFKHRSIVDNRKELLIFVTPRIVTTEKHS